MWLSVCPVSAARRFVFQLPSHNTASQFTFIRDGGLTTFQFGEIILHYPHVEHLLNWTKMYGINFDDTYFSKQIYL